MGMVHRTAILVLLSAAYTLCLVAQPEITRSGEAEALFRQSVFAYTAGDLQKAADGFDRILREFPLHQRTTASYVMKGKALLALDQPVEASRTLRDFLMRFPMSTYVPDARFTLGLTYITIGRLEDAVAQFRAGLQERGSLTPRLEQHMKNALELALTSHYTIPMIQHLLVNSTGDERLLFLVLLAQKNVSSGNITTALQLLDTLAIRYPGNPYQARIAEIQSEIEERSNVKIGALIPLMTNAPPSALKEIGREVYEGVQFAIEEFQKIHPVTVKIRVEMKDTDRDPLVAARVAQEFTSDPDIIGLVGPVFSNIASSIAEYVNERGVPMLTPTANTNGIASAGPYIFQANPDYENRGRAIARYAMIDRGLRKFGILAPSDTYGRFMAEAFVSEVNRLGGKVVASEWYARGTPDLKAQLFNIRKAGMLEGAEPFISFAGRLDQRTNTKLIQLGVSPRKLDSLIERNSIVSAVELLGADARTKLDSLEIPAVYEDPRIDSLEYPVTELDGIYLPISSPAEIGVLSSQLVYFNFKTQIFGSGEWNNLAELDAHKRYTEGVIFEVTDYVDEYDTLYAAFASGFMQRFKKKPTRNTLYGYDAAELVLTLVQQGGTTRETLRDALARTVDFQGIHSKIGLEERRVNSWLHIVQYTNNAVARLTEVNVDQSHAVEELHGFGGR